MWSVQYNYRYPYQIHECIAVERERMIGDGGNGALTSRDSDYSPDTSSTNNRPRTRRHAQKYDPDDDGGRDEEEGGVDHPRRSYASLDDEELHIR